MSQPFLGEIRMVGFQFAPVGFAFCNGALLSIADNNALFALIGTTYGGDGQNTFALPNLQGRIPVCQGSDPFGTNYIIGEPLGTENVTVTAVQIPPHNHGFPCAAAGNTGSPSNAVFAGDPNVSLYANSDGVTVLNNAFLSTAGGSQPHSNLMPFLTINFVIALQGIFPSQN